MNLNALQELETVELTELDKIDGGTIFHTALIAHRDMFFNLFFT